MRGQGGREESLDNIARICANFAHTHTEFVCPETTFLRSIWEAFLDDALSYSQKVLGLQNVTLKGQEVHSSY